MLGSLTSASTRRDLISWRKLNHWRWTKSKAVEYLVPISKSEDILEHSGQDQTTHGTCSLFEILRIRREIGDPLSRQPGRFVDHHRLNHRHLTAPPTPEIRQCFAYLSKGVVQCPVVDPDLVGEFTVSYRLTGLRLSDQDRKCSPRPHLVRLCPSGETSGNLSGVWHRFDPLGLPLVYSMLTS